jgi:magnesium-transporting ATPase (P-type)
MKAVLKASLICWGVIGAFVLFFSVVPTTTSPTVVAAFSMLLGFGFLALLGFRYRRLKKEGFEFGYFLAKQNGFWLLFLGFIGAALFLIGLVWLIAPQLIENSLEKSAMPFAAFLIVLFWFSLIFAFLGFALVCFSESVGYLRLKKIKWAAGSFAIAMFWLGLATVFCSLFLDVINDNFLQMSATTQNYILGAFALVATAIGLYAGRYRDLKELSSDDETMSDSPQTIKRKS